MTTRDDLIDRKEAAEILGRANGSNIDAALAKAGVRCMTSPLGTTRIRRLYFKADVEKLAARNRQMHLPIAASAAVKAELLGAEKPSDWKSEGYAENQPEAYGVIAKVNDIDARLTRIEAALRQLGSL